MSNIQKHTKKNGDEKQTDDDMLFMLTYMAAIATANIERGQIFEYASRRKEYSVYIYFKWIYTLTTTWGYEYAKACKSISKRASHAVLKGFFGRMTASLASGEPEKDFLRNEMWTMGEIYSNRYDRNIETLKKWTDGYTALLVSTTLIVTIVLISTMIYSIGDIYQTTLMTALLMIFICGIGISIIYTVAPYDKKMHSLKNKSKEQKIIKILSKILLPSAVLLIVALFLLKIQIGLILITTSVFIAPIGIIGMIDDKKINKRDDAFSGFIKTLGTLAGTMGITTNSAIEKLDKEMVGFIEPLINTLHAGLSLELKPNLCWEKFITDSGSELINRSTRIFNDAIGLGGDPAEIGKIVSSSSLAIVLFRMKRQLVSSGFTGLIIPLHAVMTVLLVFIIEIMTAFSEAIGKMSELYPSDIQGGMGGSAGIGMDMFGCGEDIVFLYSFTVVCVIVLTIANTVVVKIVDGGGNYKFCFYGAIMSAISGLVLIFIPIVVSGVFSFEI